LMAELLRI